MCLRNQIRTSNTAETAARNMNSFLVNIAIRFTYPLGAGGKVPPAHM